jgi:MSHA biogenesis protein MshJ
VTPLRRLNRWLDQRPRRERWFISGAVLALLVLLGDQLLLQPLLADIEQARREQGTLQQQIQTQDEELARLRVALAKDPNAAPGQRLALLEREVADLDRAIEQLTRHLIDPQEMAGVLEAMLRRVSGLRLVGLENLAPAPLAAAAAKEDAAGDDLGAFRHGLRLDLRGSFNDALDYLLLLEALPWGFFWDRLEIQVERYPANRIRIEIYTVTVGREWLGV